MKKTLLSLLLVLLTASVVAEELTLGSYSIENPLITPTYSRGVRLGRVQLESLDVTNPLPVYPTLVTPQARYTNKYEIRILQEKEPVPLSPGEYLLTLDAADQGGTSRLDLIRFTVTGPLIELLRPPFGISPTHPFDISFRVREEGEPVQSVCTWSNIGYGQNERPVDSTTGVEHTITGLNYNGFLYLRCSRETGTDVLRTVRVGWDASPPTVRVTPHPSLVRDPRYKYTILVVETDDETVCQIDGQPLAGEDPAEPADYSKRHEHRVSYNDITDERERGFSYDISCVNTAGQYGSATAEVTVSLGLSSWIDVLSPPAFTNASTFTMTVRPTFAADTCTANGKSMTQNGEVFERGFSGVRNGANTYNISCVGAQEASREYTVTVDTTLPVMDSLTIPSRACTGPVQFTYNATDNDRVASYTWTVFNSSNAVFDQAERVLSTTGETTVESGEYRVSVFATDRAGHDSRPLVSSFTVLQDDAPQCATRGCTKDADCPSGRSCVENTCASSCATDTDCAAGTICKAKACLPGCRSTSDCPATQQCVSNTCVVQGCTSNTDCSSGATCSNGVCIATIVTNRTGPTCTSDFDCPYPDVCSDGVCASQGGSGGTQEDTGTPPSPPIKNRGEEGCSSDVECSVTEECRAGVCIPRDERPVPIPSGGPGGPEGGAQTPWLAVILIILGILTMGGSGYYLYEQHQEKHRPGPPVQPVQPVFQALSPQQIRVRKAQRERVEQQQAARQRAEEQARKRRQEREQERHKLFEKFKEGDVFEKRKTLRK